MFFKHTTVWHKIFAGSNFAVFPAIRKKKFSQIKITANIFPARIYSRVNILWLKFATQKYSTKKSCLFNHNLPLSFRNKTVYNELLVSCHRMHVWNNPESNPIPEYMVNQMQPKQCLIFKLHVLYINLGKWPGCIVCAQYCHF